MTEHEINRKLVKQLESRLGGIAIKHNDRSTSGIPDISMSVNRLTTWLEVKRLRRGNSIHDAMQDAAQLDTCIKLSRNSLCWIVAFNSDKVIFYRPDILRGPHGEKITPSVPESVPSMTNDEARRLAIGSGVIAISGVNNYDAVVDLIAITHMLI